MKQAPLWGERRSKTTSTDSLRHSEINKHGDVGTSGRRILCASTHEERLMEWDAAQRPGYDLWRRVKDLRNTARNRETLKTLLLFIQCQRKEWYMMMTRRYNYSPFIWARIMKVKAGSRGETNSCMDYDYSNASCGTHRCHTGVTRFLYEPCGPLYVPFSKSECVFFHIFYHPLCLWAAD